MIIDDDVDKEIIDLILAINRFPGISTHSSCYGHDKEPISIWFDTKDLESLPPLLYYTKGCHIGYYHWKVCAWTDCGMSPVSFYLEGPVGAKEEAQDIAKDMNEAVDTYEANGVGRK
jgi:hypothetical protein